MPSKDVFISYRRLASEDLAYTLYQGLKLRNIDPFYDFQSIPAGRWLETILRQIAARPYFLLILAPGTLERCANPDDILRREILEAIMLERVIVPLTTHNFDPNDLDKYLPRLIAKTIKEHQGPDWPSSHTYYEYALDMLRDRYLRPIDIEVAIVPVTDQPALHENKVQVESAKRPELVAEPMYDPGRKQRTQEDMDRAIADYTKIIHLNPDNAIAYNNRANIFFVQEDYDQTIADCAEAIRLDPLFACAYNRRGAAYREKGKLESALADLNKAIRLDPNDADSYNNRGLVYEEKGVLDHMLADFNEAIRLNPKFALAYYNRGRALYKAGNLDGALAYYNEAIRLDPKLALAYYNRAGLYKTKKNYQAAIADHEEFLRLAPSDPHIAVARENIEEWRALLK